MFRRFRIMVVTAVSAAVYVLARSRGVQIVRCLWYANPRRAHLKHLQSGAFMLSGSLCACAFRLSCEVHVRFFPYHAQGSSASVARRLSHLACSQFSFCDGDVCSATCSDALRLRRGLTQAYVNLQAILSIDTIINCRRVHSVTVVKKVCFV